MSTSRGCSVVGMIGAAVLACGLAACGPDEPGTEGASATAPSASSPSPEGPSVTQGGSPSATGTATGDTEPWQRVRVRARVRSDGRLALTYSVRGISSKYETWGSGDPSLVDAGPRNTRVFVDGRMVGGSDGGAITCRSGTPLQRYRMHWPWFRLPEAVSAGSHVVVVRAPYCVDGRLVPSRGQVTVTVG